MTFLCISRFRGQKIIKVAEYTQAKKKATKYQPNALPNPRAVMIKAFHTVVADRTMRTTWRTIKHASITIFYFHSDAINCNFFCARKLQAWCVPSPFKWI